MPEFTVVLKLEDLYGEPVLERRPDTDAMVEELIRHRYRDRFPEGPEPDVTWVRHYQPDCWLLFATGTSPETK